MEEKTIVDSLKIKEHNDTFLETLGNFRCAGKVPEIKKHNAKFLESMQTENVEKRLHLPRHFETVPTIPTATTGYLMAKCIFLTHIWILYDIIFIYLMLLKL